MAEIATTPAQAPQAPQNTNAEPSTDGDGFAPITSQEGLNKVISERLARERSKFSDYDQLKAQAEEFRKAQDANKTAEERMAERLASLEQELNGSKLEALRSRVQARFKLADEDAELFLTGNDEATLTAQAERLAARLADAQPKKSNSVPREGRHTKAASTPLGDLSHLFRTKE